MRKGKPTMQQFKNLIDAAWLDAPNGATFETSNPANSDAVIGAFPMATKEDVEHAIDAANAALPGWANMPSPARGAILDKVSQIIDARQDEFARTLTREEGKTLAEAKVEVLRARD